MCLGEPLARTWYQQRDAQRQRWLNSRLHGITPQDFNENGVAICAPPGLTPPAAFQGAWYTIDTAQGISRELVNLASFEAVLVLCDMLDDRHVDLCDHLMRILSACEKRLDVDLPMRLLMSHSADSGLRASGPGSEDRILSVTSRLFRAGMDDAIIAEPADMQLVMGVRGKIAVCINRGRRLQKALDKHRADLQRIWTIEDTNEFTLWEYFRVRLNMVVPEVDSNLEPGDLKEIEGFKVGKLLGQGFLAKVYKLEHPAEGESQVLKSVPKNKIKSIHDLANINNQIQVMKSLSSDATCHPNIAKLLQVYHTPTHIYFRMEDAGPEDLYKWLVRYSRQGLELSLPKCKCILVQAIAALSYMHLEVMIAHRDIKPENICICEDVDGAVTIKLIDFDTGKMLKTGDTSNGVTGTFPFIAPEVFLRLPFIVACADIWSLGVVFLEVLCMTRLLESVLEVRSNTFEKMSVDEKGHEMERIKTIFQAPDGLRGLLDVRVRDELRSFVEPSLPLLTGMLQVPADKRWTTEQLRDSAAVIA